MGLYELDTSLRLKALRAKLGLSQAKLAEKCGMSQTTYANYELGTAINQKLLVGLYKLGVSLPWLLMGEGPMFRDGINPEVDSNSDEAKIAQEKTSQTNTDDTTLLIPMTNMKLSAGHGWDWESDESFTGELLPVPMKIARCFDPENLIAATVKGDSMEPTLHDGEPVAYVKQFENGDGIYALAILDEVYIKRLSIDKLKKEITIISDNPKYPAKTYPMDQEGLQVLGKVVFWIHME